MFGRRRKTPVADEDRKIVDRDRSRERTMNRAIRLLAAKPRSIAELRERLLEKPWTDAEIIEAVLAKLKEYNYLDDDQYARDLALSKLRQKPQGRRKLEQRLSQKKLDRPTPDAAYQALPESDLIDVAIEKRVRLKGVPSVLPRQI
jgi:regulatory protein